MPEESPSVGAGAGPTIVAVGASAGGLHAFECFFRAVPPGLGVTYVVVQHLAPEHSSILAQILATFTSLPVETIADGAAPRADRIHVIPPNATLAFRDGLLHLGPLEPRASRQPISGFLASLSDALGPQVVAVILSGTGSDGAEGVRAVKRSGGLAYAQSPADAQYDGMPRAALLTGDVDGVAPASDLPGLIERALRGRPAWRVPAPSTSGQEALLADIAGTVAARTGHQLSAYKPRTLLRRILRRMHALDIGELEIYARFLEQNATEAEALVRQLMIGVTGFFRDPPVFEALECQVAPPLLAEQDKRPLRVWVPGCASGEEAYSVAMVLREASRNLPGEQRSIQVFATDIDDGALETARRGRYPRSAGEAVPPALRARYLISEGEELQVSKELRDSVIFSVHDVLRDPPFSRLDLLSCRNLLIYFNPEVQERLFPLFHYALSPGGFLLLGSAESLHGSQQFEPVDEPCRIYRRREPEPAEERRQALAPLRRELLPLPPRPPGAPPSRYAQLALSAVLAEEAAAVAVVDCEGHVRFAGGAMGRFLPLRPGSPSASLLEAAGDARSALEEALRIAAHGGAPAPVPLVLRPAAGPIQAEAWVRLSAGDPDALVLVLRERRESDGADLPAGDRVARLERELQTATERWRSSVADQNSSSEQLRSANEELQTMNEELQAANEELQISQEELQSINEELHTVNAELNARVAELNALYADLQNLFQSTRIATVFLDGQLRISRFTPAASRLLPLSERDAGRPLRDLTSPFGDDLVMRLAREATDSGVPTERVAPTVEGMEWYLIRAMPYQTLSGAPDGVVLTFVDVTELKRAEEALRVAEERERLRAGELEAIMRTAPAAILISRDPMAARIVGNDTAYRLLRMAPGSNTSLTASSGERPRHFRVFHDGQELEPDDLPLQRATRGEELGDYEEQVVFDDGTHIHLWGRAVPLLGPDGRPTGAVGAFLDVTPLKDAEEAVRESNRRKDEFLGFLGHELRNPLAALHGGIDLVRRKVAADESLARNVALMDRQVQALTRLVDDVLDLTRITHGKIRLESRLLGLTDVVAAEVEAARRSAGDRLSLTLEVTGPAAWVRGDPGRIAQMVGNLLSNACKFTPAGGLVSVEVRADPGPGVVEVLVSDTGIGMDPALIPQFFEPFRQAEQSIDRARGGLGLGLALVRSLAEQMGIEVVGESPGLGRGSVFRLRFRQEEPPAQVGGRVDPGGRPSRLRILVVDDNPDVLQTLAEYLSEVSGHEVATARDGTSALEVARAFHPAAVVCDLGLPGMDGFEVARALRADPATRQVAVFALSGYGRAADRSQALAAGFDAHLTKPVEIDALEALLARVAARAGLGATPGGGPSPAPPGAPEP